MFSKKRMARRAPSSEISSDESTQPAVLKFAKPKPALKTRPTEPRSPSASSSSSSSSSADDSDEEQTRDDSLEIMSGTPSGDAAKEVRKQAHRRRTPSPSPPPAPISSFLPQAGAADAQKAEQELKEKFRKFWMASVADGFRDDLEQIHKEPNMTTSRLALLIDSLASGADVYSSSVDGVGAMDISEMGIVLNNGMGQVEGP
ncbi:hypothetical protein K488DRAFT_75556 [Vararia minispora EC-137]|uniref:Uncharacterized protein n=1 Tax=Vararia minispora EC-137 TaxID=1314806 RepID=A0ACB8QZ84_9AGAM|nr:hypothetical protein K488DRAFT_75556 [Vararia minispora EC-137]